MANRPFYRVYGYGCEHSIDDLDGAMRCYRAAIRQEQNDASEHPEDVGECKTVRLVKVIPEREKTVKQKTIKRSAQIFTSEDEFASSQRVHRFVEYIPEQYK